MTPNICVLFSKKEHHFASCIIFLVQILVFQGKNIYQTSLSLCYPTAFPTLCVRILLTGVEATARVVAATSCFLVQGKAPGKQPWVAWTQDQLIWRPFVYQSFATKDVNRYVTQKHMLPNHV